MMPIINNDDSAVGSLISFYDTISLLSPACMPEGPGADISCPS